MIQIASYGAGTNSKAMVSEMVRRGERLDAITFSDTRAERPEIYADIERFSGWLVSRGYPPVTALAREPAKVGDGFAQTLEDECLARKQLPSVAYGFKSCSDKWKMQPFRKWLNEQNYSDAVTVCIGFDADEAHRAHAGDRHSNGYAKRYPLLEWQWGREECIRAIAASGLDQPGKSACFFCPNSKPHEIIRLHSEPPDLMARALAMEANAETHIPGLGRNFAWRDVVRMEEAQFKMFPVVAMPCDCYDGD